MGVFQIVGRHNKIVAKSFDWVSAFGQSQLVFYCTQVSNPSENQFQSMYHQCTYNTLGFHQWLHSNVTKNRNLFLQALALYLGYILKSLYDSRGQQGGLKPWSGVVRTQLLYMGHTGVFRCCCEITSFEAYQDLDPGSLSGTNLP